MTAGTVLHCTRTDLRKWMLAIWLLASTTKAPSAAELARQLGVTSDRGDVVELLDTNGNAFAAYRYDAWGNPTSTTSQATSLITAALASNISTRQLLRYASYCYDAESGLYYCSARYYDPATRQWTTADSAKADGEESAYQYCSGDPVGNVDPSGEWRLSRTFRASSWYGGYFYVYVSRTWDGWDVSGLSMWAGSLHPTYGVWAMHRYDWGYCSYTDLAWILWGGRFKLVAGGAYGSYCRSWITKPGAPEGTYAGEIGCRVYIYKWQARSIPWSRSAKIGESWFEMFLDYAASY